LKLGGVGLLDAQFLTSHLAQFGAVEIPRDDYVPILDAVTGARAQFPDGPLSGREVLEAIEAK
jgi:leucyl/phenylalanyl-tRNA--protein transferase